MVFLLALIPIFLSVITRIYHYHTLSLTYFSLGVSIVISYLLIFVIFRIMFKKIFREYLQKLTLQRAIITEIDYLIDHFNRLRVMHNKLVEGSIKEYEVDFYISELVRSLEYLSTVSYTHLTLPTTERV